MDAKPGSNWFLTSPSIRFGDAAPEPAVQAFRRELNQEIIGLLRSLPGVLHTDAVLFCMQHLGTPIVPEFDYFRQYHAPAWSVLHWITRRPAASPLTPDQWAHAKTAHAMALLLHPLDDHLNDGQLPATHLNILLRSQAWRLMHAALTPLAAAVPDGTTIVDRFIEAYYASIGKAPPQASLDGYCAHFHHQLATWLIVPVLLAHQGYADTGAAAALEKAYAAFGTAWRLIDDLQDIESDRRSGSRSAVYFCLPAYLQAGWPRSGTPHGPPSRLDRVDEFIAAHAILDTIRARAASELAMAAEIAAAQDLGGLALEFQALARPLAEKRRPS